MQIGDAIIYILPLCIILGISKSQKGFLKKQTCMKKQMAFHLNSKKGGRIQMSIFMLIENQICISTFFHMILFFLPGLRFDWFSKGLTMQKKPRLAQFCKKREYVDYHDFLAHPLAFHKPSVASKNTRFSIILFSSRFLQSC